MFRNFFYLLLFTTNYLSVNSQTKIDSNFHLYFLAGQSNMAGRGEITGKYALEGHPNVYMLNKEGEWVLAKHPLHFDKPQVAGVGPGLAFAIKMAEANPNIKIGLVPCAVGGSSINVWKPGALDKNTNTHPYDDAMKRIHIAMQSGIFKGALWHQGESDSNPESAGTYMPKLISLIAEIRAAVKNPNLPFVAGQLGPYKDVYDNINKVIEALPDKMPFTAIASSKGLKHKGDVTHFDSQSAEKLGQRFAKKMKKLQRKLKRSEKKK